VAADFAALVLAVVDGRVEEDVLAVEVVVAPVVVAGPAAAAVAMTIRATLASRANRAGKFKISVSVRAPQSGSGRNFALINLSIRRRAYGRTYKL
jgi:hypothetical protein